MRPFFYLVLSCCLIFASYTPRQAAEASPLRQIPSVTLDLPEDVLIGGPFDFTVTFQNTAATGYGPFIDLLLPLSGADGPSNPDGIDFISADLMGIALTVEQVVFPGATGATTCISHPFARSTTNTPLQVCGRAGDKLVSIRLPFGSVVTGQPAVDITITAQISPLADPGTPLTLRARGGFEFGANALNDPCCDPVILTPGTSDSTAWPGTPTRPVLMRLIKRANTPEDSTETVTGPNFNGQYTISLDIANGQTITNLNVTDFLPPTEAYVSVVSATPGGVVTTSPATGAAHNPPNNELTVNFASVTGGSGTQDVEVIWEYTIPQVDANGNPVLNPTSGDAIRANNDAQGIGDWIPADPRDSATAGNATAPGGAAPEHSMWFRSLAVQKDLSIQADNAPTGYSPGDTLHYVLTFQVSDFFTYGDLLVTDTLSDGQRLDAGFTPTFSITDRSGTFNGTFAASNFAATVSPTTGQTTLSFNVEQALIDAGDDGILQGGRTVAPDAIGATGTITYRAAIQESFSNTTGDPSVDQGDLLNNQVNIAGTVRNNAAIGTPIGNETDTSVAEARIVRGTLEKTIYAVNGAICATQPCAGVIVDPGDTITYRIRYSLPLSDADNLSFSDYLPLPTFDATSVTAFNSVVNAGPPAAGSAQFGPTDTFYALSTIVPSIVSSATTNQVIFNYGSYDNAADPSAQIDILFTASVLARPYADSLVLANFVESNERLTNLSVLHRQSAAGMIVRQPLLVLRKSVIGSSNLSAILNPPNPGAVPFNPPGTSGVPWSTSVISSDSLTANDINSDLSGAVPGDLVRFAIVVENVGAAGDGAFDLWIADVLPAGLRIPSSGINLTATRGDGTPVSYLGSPTDLFGAGIELVDPGPTEGVCQTYNATNGRNIVIVTYDLQVDTTGPAGGMITNRGRVASYTSVQGANFNYMGDAQLFSDSATIGASGQQTSTTSSDISITKTGEWQQGAVGVAGERLTWVITIRGAGSNIVVTDTINAEMSIRQASIDRGTTSINGQTVTFTIPTLNAGETAIARIETTVVRSSATGILTNTAILNTGSVTRSASASVEVATSLPNTGYQPAK